MVDKVGFVSARRNYAPAGPTASPVAHGNGRVTRQRQHRRLARPTSAWVEATKRSHEKRCIELVRESVAEPLCEERATNARQATALRTVEGVRRVVHRFPNAGRRVDLEPNNRARGHLVRYPRSASCVREGQLRSPEPAPKSVGIGVSGGVIHPVTGLAARSADVQERKNPLTTRGMRP